MADFFFYFTNSRNTSNERQEVFDNSWHSNKSLMVKICFCFVSVRLPPILTYILTNFGMLPTNFDVLILLDIHLTYNSNITYNIPSMRFCNCNNLRLYLCRQCKSVKREIDLHTKRIWNFCEKKERRSETKICCQFE